MTERKYENWSMEEVDRVEKELSDDIESLNKELESLNENLELLKKDIRATESALNLVGNIIKPEVVKNHKSGE